MATKNSIFEEKLGEYCKANKRRKGTILEAVCEVSGITRKGAIKRFRRMQRASWKNGRRAGRPTVYGKNVDAALYTVWEAGDEMCGELLHSVIGDYVRCFRRGKDWKYGRKTTEKLLSMSKSTVRRRTETFERKRPTAKGLSSTKPSHLKQIIPIFKGPWNNCLPGEGQIDTVAHCGYTLAGNFIRTVCFTDAPTYWVVPRAQWNIGQEATRKSIEDIRKCFPVSLLHLHPDTGSEFINWHLKEWCEKEDIRLTRSEPGKKNDNMYVEERNGHVVRAYLGYTRFDCRFLVPLINEMYDVLAVYLNHFHPVRRTLSKERVGSKYRRVYEKQAKTPYQRMLESEHVSCEVKEKLQKKHEALNPLILKRKVDVLLSKIFNHQRNHNDGRCGCGSA